MIAIAAWAACSVYSADLLEPAVAVDAGPDVQAPSDDATADAADADPCLHAYAPPRPAKDDPSDASDDVDYVSVLTAIDFGLDAGGAPSFDLDHTCTCPGPESCVPVSGSPPHCDDVRGGDNSAGGLFAKLVAVAPSFDPSNVTQQFYDGIAGLVFVMHGYNGAANDTQVRVSVFDSNGLMSRADGGTDKPKHDGTDEWSASPRSLLGGVGPPFVPLPESSDPNAYVTNDQLVSVLDVRLLLGGAWHDVDPIPLKGAIVVGTLTRTAAGLSLSNGHFAGRVSTSQILSRMQILPDPFSTGNFLCGSDVTYQAVKGAICGASDVSTNLLGDPSTPCDAISLALGFTAEPARLTGVIADGPAKMLPCGATYSDQCP